MHFWQLFHLLRVLLLLPSCRPPLSRFNPSVSLSRLSRNGAHRIRISSPAPRLGTLGGATALGDEIWRRCWNSILYLSLSLRAEIHRKPIEDSKRRSTTSDDPYEKLMLSDLEIHPWAFDKRTPTGRWFPGFTRSGCGVRRIKCSDRRIVAKGHSPLCGLLRKNIYIYIYIDQVALHTSVGDTRSIKIAIESFPR